MPGGAVIHLGRRPGRFNFPPLCVRRGTLAGLVDGLTSLSDFLRDRASTRLVTAIDTGTNLIVLGYFQAGGLGRTAMALIDQSNHGFESTFQASDASKLLVVFATVLSAVCAVSFLLLQAIFT